MDLFSSNPENSCLTYQNLFKDTSGLRACCEDLWREYERYADPHFVTEFSTRTHERWFEMYLTITFLRAGYDVSCPKPGPDILLNLNSRRIWVEAVCATKGEPGLPDSVPEPRIAKPGEPVEVTDVPVEQYVLRILNALSAKERIYREYLAKGWVSQDDTLVIAINVASVCWLWADMNDHMMRSLYGLGHIALAIDPKTKQVVDRRRIPVIQISKKSSGLPVGTQPFIDGSIPHISAVIGARRDFANLPRQLGDDLVTYPNLTSEKMLSHSMIALGEEWNFQRTDDGWKGESISHAKRSI